MKNKKQKIIQTLRHSYVLDPYQGTDLQSLMDEFEKIKKEYPNFDEYFFHTEIDEGYCGDIPILDCYFTGKRLETDEEYNKRLEKEEQKKKRDKENARKSKLKQEEIERKQYERLKKKFEK